MPDSITAQGLQELGRKFTQLFGFLVMAAAFCIAFRPVFPFPFFMRWNGLIAAAIVPFLSALFIYYVPPEAKGKTLEEAKVGSACNVPAEKMSSAYAGAHR